MSSGFGQWYEETKAAEAGGETGAAGTSSSSWGLSTDSLPLFNTESMQSISWGNMKASMEAQMPKKIMGMGYQQRFKVRAKSVMCCSLKRCCADFLVVLFRPVFCIFCPHLSILPFFSSLGSCVSATKRKR